MATKPQHELKIKILAEPRVHTFDQAIERAESAALSFFGEDVKPYLTYRAVLEQDPVGKRFIGNVFVYLGEEKKEEANA